MELPTALDYPIVAVGDLHGQSGFLDKLVERLRRLPEWERCRLVFLGDLVDRGPDVKGTVERVLALLEERPGSTAILGNHDLALVRAARLDDGPESPFWLPRYRSHYDHVETFQSYLGRGPKRESLESWRADLQALKDAVPERHRRLLSGLCWAAAASGHVFLHNGLSTELKASAEEQLDAMLNRRWDRSLRPIGGTKTAELWTDEYPVWIGADKGLSAHPRPLPGRVQVSGHVHILKPDVNAVRIRIDTSGGLVEPLTACLLRGPKEPQEFIFSV
jgi:serine/threonine protein phosphatase 1